MIIVILVYTINSLIGLYIYIYIGFIGLYNLIQGAACRATARTAEEDFIAGVREG